MFDMISHVLSGMDLFYADPLRTAVDKNIQTPPHMGHILDSYLGNSYLSGGR